MKCTPNLSIIPKVPSDVGSAARNFQSRSSLKIMKNTIFTIARTAPKVTTEAAGRTFLQGNYIESVGLVGQKHLEPDYIRGKERTIRGRFFENKL